MIAAVRVFIAYLREAGLAAAERAAPLYFGIGIVAAILFGSANAMRASDALQAFASSRPLRIGFWTAWIIATAPAARLLFATPTTFYLRSLPRTRAPLAAAVSVGLIAVEAPWIALFARGGGALSGATTAALAASLHGALLAPAPLVALVLVVAIGWPAPPSVLLGLGLAGAIASGRAAFRVAPERAARSRRRLVRGPAPVALGLAYLAVAWRGTRPAFIRAVLVGAAGGALTGLVGRNNGVSGSVAFALGMTGPILVVAAGGIVEAVVAVEREAGWILTTSRTSMPVRAAARAGAAGAAGLVLGAGVAAIVAAGVGGGVGLVAAVALWGGALAAVLTSVERIAARSGERDGGVAVSCALGLAILAATSGGILGAPALALLALTVALAELVS